LLNSTVVCDSSLEARRNLDLCVVSCTYAPSRGGTESHSIRSTSLLEASRLFSP